nr:immunoglobulin light chain junction region [Macaca mulatta]MOW08629.1 immunoglobulin light chain junction region [Macaca mulatta]MOW09138.1 immunoglobulin light chain junction region [Macaca mulatta]
CQQDNTTPLTF